MLLGWACYTEVGMLHMSLLLADKRISPSANTASSLDIYFSCLYNVTTSDRWISIANKVLGKEK